MSSNMIWGCHIDVQYGFKNSNFHPGSQMVAENGRLFLLKKPSSENSYYVLINSHIIYWDIIGTDL